MASLFGRVAVLGPGRLLVATEADALRGGGVEVVGGVAEVERSVAASGLDRLSERRLGGTLAVVAHGELSDADRAAAGVELGPLPLRDLFVHLTGAADTADTADTAGVTAEEAS